MRADKLYMLEVGALSIIFLLLCAIAGAGFRQSIRKPIVALNVETYSRRALKIERAYKIMTWGLLTLALFYWTAVSFFLFIFEF